MSHRIKSNFSATKGVCDIKISGFIGEIFVYNTQITMTSYNIVWHHTTSFTKNKAKSKFSTLLLRSTENLSNRNVVSAIWNLFDAC